MLMPKWSNKLAGFDLYIRHPCYSVQQSRRIDRVEHDATPTFG